MPFQKGQSGNPGGRKKAAPELREMARSYTAEALGAAVKILRKPKAADQAKLKAAEIILERGHGKPTQHIEADVNVFDNLTLDQRRALDAALVALAGTESDAEENQSGSYH